MAWQTPVTDRVNSETRTTAGDMNRISGNINYLWATGLREDFTEQDIVTVSEWESIIAGTNEIADLLSMPEASDATTHTNLNHIETIAAAYYELGPLFPAESLYPAEDLYPR